MKIALLLIATNKYKSFVQPLIDSVKQYFLLNHQIEVHIFTDEVKHYTGDPRVTIVRHDIESYKFPYATLYRYKIFTAVEFKCDYIYYLDVDMSINGVVGDEILGDLVAVRHPGYYNGGWGSKNVDPRSMAFMPKENWKKYFAGGFQGGKSDVYYSAMQMMSNFIDTDEQNGVMAEWHDESHWNAFLNSIEDHVGITELSPSYCMPESFIKRAKWGISHLKPLILALEKDFNTIRT